jgi:hypothetical protein
MFDGLGLAILKVEGQARRIRDVGEFGRRLGD